MKVKEYAGFGAKPLRARVNTDEFRANYSEAFAQGELTNAQVFELARDDETIGEARERIMRGRGNAIFDVVRGEIGHKNEFIDRAIEMFDSLLRSGEVSSGIKFVRVDLPPDHPAVTVPAQMKYGNAIYSDEDSRFPSAFPLGKCVCWDTGCYSCRCKDAGRGV